jgi:hypothetical protein
MIDGGEFSTCSGSESGKTRRASGTQVALDHDAELADELVVPEGRRGEGRPVGDAEDEAGEDRIEGRARGGVGVGMVDLVARASNSPANCSPSSCA